MKKNKSIYFYLIIVLIIISVSCKNKHESINSNEEYYINSRGDTMTVTKPIGDSLYQTIKYRMRDGKKVKSEIIHHFDDAMPHGKSITYHSNGQLKSVVEFKEGKIWEVNKYMDSMGRNLDYGFIDKGEGFLKKYYVDLSLLEEEGKVKDGYKYGYWIQYCGDGKRVCDSTLYDKGKSQIMKDIEEEGLPVYQMYN